MLYIGSVAEASILIPIIVALFYRKYIHGSIMSWLLLYIFITFVRNVITVTDDVLIFYQLNFNNLFFYNWHNVLTTFIVFTIYKQLLVHRYWNFVYWFAMLTFALFTLLEFQNDSLTYIFTVHFNTYTYTVANLFIIVFSLGYFYQLLQDLSIENITQFPYFWMNAGFLIFHTGSMFVYVFLLVGTYTDAQIAWVITSILTIFLYISLTLTFYYSRTIKKIHA